jgi:hypothetical protein
MLLDAAVTIAAASISLFMRFFPCTEQVASRLVASEATSCMESMPTADCCMSEMKGCVDLRSVFFLQQFDAIKLDPERSARKRVQSGVFGKARFALEKKR